MDFFKANIWEIRNTTSLKFLGAILSLSHLLLYFSWWQNTPLFSGQPAACWSFIPNCQEMVLTSNVNIQLFKYIYLFFIIIALICFVTRRALAFGVFSLFITTLLHILFMLLDASGSQNLNIFVVWLSLFFVLIPQKVRVSKIIIISAYMLWGILKISNEWLAGYWLSKNMDFYLPPKGIEWIAAITLFAEIVVPLFLISRQAQRFFTGIVLLFIYASFHGYILGLQYFAIPVLILMFCVFNYFEEEKEARESIYRSYIRPEPTKLWVAFSILFIWFFQIFAQSPFKQWSSKNWPMVYLKDPIPVECKFHTFAIYENEIQHISSQLLETTNENMQCNNLIYFKHAQSMCNELSREPKFKGVSAYFLKRLISQKDYVRVFEFENICGLSAKSTIGSL